MTSSGVKALVISCPSCGSADVAPTGENNYRCNHCETSFLTQTSAPAQAAPLPQARGRLPLYIGAGAALMLVTGLTVHLLESPDQESRRERRRRARPTLNRKKSKPPKPTKAKLTQIVHDKTSIGGEFWLIDYKNVGEVDIHSPKAVVSLFDSAGKRVGDQPGYGELKVLAPGETTTLMVLVSKPPVYEKSELVAEASPSTSHVASRVPIVVLDYVEQPDAGHLRHLVGSVKNETKEGARYITIVAVGRDPQGRPVSYARGSASRRALAPGESSGFNISVGTFESERPAQWELFAQGALDR